ncbi:MAG: hypothetical protein FJ096_00130 [Deltaproteobacteria bacterium]|nr:hypothetical protein [Deltaproteobacteria bacterium]
MAAAFAGLLGSGSARAIDVPLGNESMTLDVSNTSDLGYHFDNRNTPPLDPANPTLSPLQRLDDDYGDWFDRLQVRAFYKKFSFALRVDSAVFFNLLDREGTQAYIREKLGRDDLALENRFGEELQSHFGQPLPGGARGVIYPSKISFGYKNEFLDATLGDFYLQLGRGLILSVRKIDEVGIDTTIRGAKVRVSKSQAGHRVEATGFAGQFNPIRIDYPTGRILNGSGSLVFPGSPTPSDFSEWVPNPKYSASSPGAEPEFLFVTKRAKPSYLEDGVVGANFTYGTRLFELGLNGVSVLRQSNSAEFELCKNRPGADVDACQASYPAFGQVGAARLHDQIRNLSATVNVPSIAGVGDAYVEVAAQHQTQGRVSSIGPNGIVREPDLTGYAVYANLNLHQGPLAATLEGKHYRRFFPLAANIDAGGPPFGAPELNLLAYSLSPRAESIYTEPIGAPDVCISGGRARLDYAVARERKVYGWVGRFASWSELDPTNSECKTDPALRTDTWDTAAGLELSSRDGNSHYWGWIGARLTDLAVPTLLNTEQTEPSDVFYREGYIRYDLGQHLKGPFSISMVGFHRHRTQALKTWTEGENLLALNYNPSFSFIFGFEHTTREGFPNTYFNGAIAYRASSRARWYHKLAESVRLFVGQRRAALRCVGGVCRVFPAFEGARIEVVSRF